ncbi:MAG: restriction endonuclease subunit S [Lachnoanaerobaculum saburreum]
MHARIGWQNLRTTEFLDDGKYLLITGTDFVDGKIDFTRCYYVKQERYNQDRNIQIKNGCILITKDGTLGKVAYVNGLNKPATLNAGIFNVEIRDENKVDRLYLYQYIKAPFLLEYVNQMATGGTIKHLNQNILVDFMVSMPQSMEQKKIGELFQILDHLITLHQSKPFGHILKVIASYTLYWEQRKLGEIAERLTRKNEKLESTLPLTISAQYGLIDQNEFFDKRIASKDVRGYYLIKKGEFAYNKSTSVDAPFGAIKRLDKYNKGVLSTLYILFKIIDDTNTSSDYLVTYYSTDLWHKGIQLIAAEGARNHGLLNITPNDFFKTMLSIPLNVFEQQKIGNFFKSLDHLITLHQLEPFKLIFKAIAYRIIDYAKSKPPRYIKYADLN